MFTDPTGESAAAIPIILGGGAVIILSSPAGQKAASDAIKGAVKAIKTLCEDKKPDCRKASKWDLQQAQIFDEHAYKKGHGAVPEAHYDICKCKDGTIRIAAVGMCGKTNDFWD